LIHPDDVWVYDSAQGLYPGATFETVYDPAGRTPVLYVVTLAGSDIERVQGLELRTWAGPGREGQPGAVARVPGGDALWPDPVPLSSSQAGALAAEWSGVLYAPAFGRYGFELQAPEGATLQLDDRTIVGGERESREPAFLELAQGNHSLRLRALSAPGQVRLLWQPPGGPWEAVPRWALYAPPVSHHGLRGDYYANQAWEGSPLFSRIDPFLDLYFHLTPLPRPYSVEWSGALQVPRSGNYRIGLRAVDWADLALDGRTIVETRAPGQDAVTMVALEQGRYELHVRFRDATERSLLRLLWQPPGQEDLAPIPAHYLWP
jgi:hypothetical protein